MKTMTKLTTTRPPKSGAASLLRDPVLFARVVLGADLWKSQRDILYALAHHRRVAVKACHASGKSYAIAIAALWWLTVHRDGIVVTTAPTWLQVEKIVWGEIKNAVLRSRLRGKINFPIPTSTELRLGPQNYAIGVSTDESSRFQGFHSAHVLIVLDEAPGVRNEIYEAVEGISAGGDVRILALGNPVVAGGPFYDAFASGRNRWKTITIDALATPNMCGLSLDELRQLPRDLPEDHPIFGFAPRPYLITRHWVYDALHTYGEDSPFWQGRVRGQFPEQTADALISLKWIEDAKNRARKDAGGKIYAGIDVAGPGEAETVAYVRQGPNVIAFGAWSKADPRGDVIAFLNPFRERLESVNIDSIGIGYNFALHIDDQGFPVTQVNVGEPARDNEQFANSKAEYYWGLRGRFAADDIAGVTDELTLSQLATIRYEHTSRGQVKIESKEDARKRGVKSPDRAEALMLCFANRTPPMLEWIEGYVNHQQSVEAAMREGRRPPPDDYSAENLQRAYDEIQNAVEFGGALFCPKCGGKLGPRKTMESDGRYYHPECVRPW